MARAAEASYSTVARIAAPEASRSAMLAALTPFTGSLKVMRIDPSKGTEASPGAGSRPATVGATLSTKALVTE